MGRTPKEQVIRLTITMDVPIDSARKEYLKSLVDRAERVRMKLCFKRPQQRRQDSLWIQPTIHSVREEPVERWETEEAPQR